MFGSSESSHVQKEKVDQWYFEPLRKMRGDQAFVAMTISIILYEKYLRTSKKLGGGKIFRTQNAKAFKIMSEDFGFPAADCFRFWQDWRNGLMHRAMPTIGHFAGYTLSGERYPRALQIDGKTLKIDPWKFRDVVLSLVEKDRVMWKDPKNPLAKIMTSTEVE